MFNGRAVKTRAGGKGSVIKFRRPLSTRVGPVGGKVRPLKKIYKIKKNAASLIMLKHSHNVAHTKHTFLNNNCWLLR